MSALHFNASLIGFLPLNDGKSEGCILIILSLKEFTKFSEAIRY